MAGGITVSNGLAWSPDARTLYWADTKAHTVFAFDFDRSDGSAVAPARLRAVPAQERRPGRSTAYGGRPDGAAVDSRGRLLGRDVRGCAPAALRARRRVTREVTLPVRCPTMPCFGGADLRTLYVTTAREKRPADELAREPLAGCVLQLRVDVPGLPANFAQIQNGMR